jgi:hypothetical protein
MRGSARPKKEYSITPVTGLLPRMVCFASIALPRHWLGRAAMTILIAGQRRDLIGPAK